jgi:endonuclease YncB( thermonuclease family)
LTQEGALHGRVLHGGADINQHMLEIGLLHFKRDQNLPEAILARYAKSQYTAQQRKLGLWKKQK